MAIETYEAFEKIEKYILYGCTAEAAVYARIFIELLVDSLFDLYGEDTYDDDGDKMSLFGKIDYIDKNTNWLSSFGISYLHRIRKTANRYAHPQRVYGSPRERRELKWNCESLAKEFVDRYDYHDLLDVYNKYRGRRTGEYLCKQDINEYEWVKIKKLANRYNLCSLLFSIIFLFALINWGQMPYSSVKVFSRRYLDPLRSGSYFGMEYIDALNETLKKLRLGFLSNDIQTADIDSHQNDNDDMIPNTDENNISAPTVDAPGNRDDLSTNVPDGSTLWGQIPYSSNMMLSQHYLDLLSGSYLGMEYVDTFNEILKEFHLDFPLNAVQPTDIDSYQNDNDDMRSNTDENNISVPSLDDSGNGDDSFTNAPDGSTLSVDASRYIVKTETSSGHLNVRRTPVDGDVIGMLDNGSECIGTGNMTDNEKWVEIYYPNADNTGWVSMRFLEKE